VRADELVVRLRPPPLGEDGVAAPHRLVEMFSVEIDFDMGDLKAHGGDRWEERAVVE